MNGTLYDRSTLRNYFPLPNSIFSLGLKPDPLSSYFYKRMFSVAVLNVVPNPNAESLNTGWINIPKATFRLEKAKKTE